MYLSKYYFVGKAVGACVEASGMSVTTLVILVLVFVCIFVAFILRNKNNK